MTKKEGSAISDQVPARARELGVVVGELRTGPSNAITDVADVLVGQTTLVEGASIRTGVTAIVPSAVLAPDGTLPAALAVANGYGKFIGSTQIDELGVIETPIVLTATLSAFAAADALVGYVLALPGWNEVRSVNPVVGETNDGFLSDIRARPVRAEHVVSALTSASAGPVAEGAVGAGTGTCALGFKAGIGTSSRVLDHRGETMTVAALVQANFSGTLTVTGVPVAERAGAHPPADADQPGGGSCVIVVATDARLDARQLKRLARRALAALARTGSDFSGHSGDYALAFSTAPPGGPVLADSALDPLFRAGVDSAQEALLNSLTMARTTTGHKGHVRRAVPHDWVRKAANRRSPEGTLSSGSQADEPPRSS